MPPTVSLCMITYEKDAEDLKRCLQAFTQNNFIDEIIIVDTSKEPSSEIKLICSSYQNLRLYHRAFNDNFSEVRNYSFDQATGDFLLWCDSDDVISLESLNRLLDLKPNLPQYDVWILDYWYAFDAAGKPALILPRERIVKNSQIIRWIEPVHECLTIQDSTMTRVNIPIEHRRSRHDSPDRNLRILRPQYQTGTISYRGMFYLGKELFDCQLFEEAVPVLEKYLTTASGKDFVDNLWTAAFKLAQWYGSNKDFAKCKNFALMSYTFSQNYAETSYMLGEVYQEEGKYRTAIEYYQEALQKRLGTAGMSQLPMFYNFLPNRSLALLYKKLGDHENARKHAITALTYAPDPALSEIVGNQVSTADIKACWLYPGRADITNGSHRIRRLNLQATIPSSKNIECYLDKPYSELLRGLDDSNTVIFQNFCKEDLWLIRLLKQMGKVTIFDDCEGISGYPWQKECMQEADAITCCSEVLAKLRSSQGCKRVAVVPDAYEPTSGMPQYDRTSLTAGFVGMGGNSWMVDSWLRSTIEAAGYKILICTEWDNADVKWSLDNWAETMYSCDVILCPQRVDIQPAKSNVKVTQAMSMGLPVICSPLDAYTKIVKHGENGYIAADIQGWSDALIALKDPVTRRRIGEAGKASVGAYSIENVSAHWKKVVTDLLQMKGVSTKEPTPVTAPVSPPEVTDLIIPVYNNWQYLRLLLDSILFNTTPDTPYRIIISDAGSNEETWDQLKKLKGMVILGEPGKMLSFSEACNAGIRASNTKFFVIMNSDIIVSKGWLTNILKKMKSEHRLSSCGVLSNCDDGWLINAPGKPTIDLKINNLLTLHPGMKIETIAPNLDALYRWMESSNLQNKDKFVQQDWVAGYCTCYARSAVDEVGLFDPLYVNGCEDLDLERRLRAFGFKAGQAYDAFVLHFGGVTRYNLQQENASQYDKDDALNHMKFKDKWAKKRVAIYTGPAWEPWDASTVEAGMAGSESWAVYIAEEFVKLGYDTTIYGHLERQGISKVFNGVRYIDHRDMLVDLSYICVDLFISSRTVEPAKYPIHALKTYVMTHDIWLHPDPNHDMETWRVHRYYYLSGWHKRFMQEHHKSIPWDKLVQTSNGVAPYYYTRTYTHKKSNRSVYSSSPDRGLYQLLMMLPEIKKEVPDFEIDICYGFFNWESAAKQRNDIRSIELIGKIKSLMDQPGVLYYDRLDKKRLRGLQCSANVWLYPTHFTETFGITAIENRFCGNAIVTTDLAGLQRTAGAGSMLLPPTGLSRDNLYPESYTQAFIEEAVKLLTDESYRKQKVELGYQDLDQYRWDIIVKDFL